MQAIAGRDTEAFDRSVDVLIGRLRRKVELIPERPELIVTGPASATSSPNAPLLGGTPAMLPQSTAAREPDRPSIAVLPFANLSGDPEQDYFADGMVEEIITALSRIRWLFVIARNSSFTYKGRAVDVKQVGRELGVRYVLEGSVRKAGGRVRITVQLIDASTGAHVWAERFDGVLEDIFDLQDEITASVVGAIEPQLRDAELSRGEAAGAQQSRPPTIVFSAAWPSALRVRAKTTMRRCACCDSAIASDPEFAPPYASPPPAAFTGRGTDGPEILEATGDSAWNGETAAQLGAGDSDVLALAGHAIGYLAGEYNLSLSLTEQALVLNPSSATAFSLAAGRACMRATQIGNMHFLRGTRLNPIDTKRFILDSWTGLCLPDAGTRGGSSRRGRRNRSAARRTGSMLRCRSQALWHSSVGLKKRGQPLLHCWSASPRHHFARGTLVQTGKRARRIRGGTHKGGVSAMMSADAACRSRSLSTKRWTLPLGFFGSSSRNSISRG